MPSTGVPDARCTELGLSVLDVREEQADSCRCCDRGHTGRASWSTEKTPDPAWRREERGQGDLLG